MAEDIPRIFKPKIDPALIINKLERPSQGTLAPEDFGDIYSISNDIDNIASSNKEILELFPDMEIAKDTLLTNIVNGINMFNNPLLYTSETEVIDPSTKSKLNTIFSKHINKIYDLNGKLYSMTEEALFSSGAYCEIFIPEGVISSMLGSKMYDNKDVESIIDIRINNSPKSFDIDIESTSERQGLSLGVSLSTDLSLINKTDLQVISNKDTSVDLEYVIKDKSLKASVAELKKLFLKNKNNNASEKQITLDTIDSIQRKSIGLPLILKVPTESIIPICSNYDPSKHIKYILLLDEFGNPLSTTVNTIDVASNGSVKDIISQALSQTRDITTKAKTLNISNEFIYETLVSDISKRIESNTMYKIKESMLNDVYYTAFTRYLSGKKTRIILVDKESVNYLAFAHRENGTGKSMLEKLGPLVSMRAILLMTRMNAHIDNSITKFKVVADLDEKDPRYKKTAASIINTAYKSRNNKALFGVRDFQTLNDLISKSGIYFQINHPKLPKMTVDFENINSDKREPDNDFYDSIKKDSIRVFGLTPEQIDDASSDEYATSFKIKNALFNRRVTTKRNILSAFTTEYCRKAYYNDMLLQEGVKEVIRLNIKELVRHVKFTDDNLASLKDYSLEAQVEFFSLEFIEGISCRLPNEEPLENNALNDAFESYKDRLEEIMETMFSSDALPDEFISEVGGKLDAIRGSVQNTLLRKWMSDNDYMPEVVNVFNVDTNGNTTNTHAEEFIVYLKQVLESSNALFDKDLLKTLKASDKKVKKYEERLNSDEPIEEEPKEEEPIGDEPKEEPKEEEPKEEPIEE